MGMTPSCINLSDPLLQHHIHMAPPNLTSNVVDVNNCFSELSKSCEQNISGIHKLKKEIQKLKTEPEGRVATGKVNQWLGDLESLEGNATAINENIKRMVLRENIRIGPWGYEGKSSFDFGRSSSRIKTIEIHTGAVVDGLKLWYVVDRNIITTFLAGGSGGNTVTEIELVTDEYINWMVGFMGVHNGENCITQLQFTTNFGKKYGPFGDGGGTKFEVPAKDGHIVGFFGQFTNYINEIGVYMASN